MHCSSEYSDHQVVRKKLKGLDEIIWLSFGRRTYAKNSNERGYLFSQVFFFAFVIGSIAFFEYFPFKIFGFLCMVAVTAVAISMPIKHANISPNLIWVNVMIGAIGFMTHGHFGLTIFGFHLEQYLFWIYLIGGLLAVYRRFWNHVIWKKLEKIAVQYYLDHPIAGRVS